MGLRSFQQVMWNRRWVILAVVLVAIAASPKLKHFVTPTYSATAEISYVGSTSQAVIVPADLPLLALSSSVLRRAAADGRLGVSGDQLGGNAIVRESPHSEIIPVVYRSTNPVFSVRAANAIADATVVEYKQLATRQYDQVIGKLNDQLADLRQRISSFDARYQASVHADPMAGTSTAIDSMAARLDTLDTNRIEARAKLASDLAAATTDGGTSNSPEFKSVVREETLSRDPAYVALLNAKSKDAAEYETTKAGYTDAYPGLAGLREKVSIESEAVSRMGNVSANLHRGASPTYASMLVSQKAAQSMVAADRAQVAILDQAYTDTRARLNNLPRLTVPADDFRVQRDGAATAYSQVELRLRNLVADKSAADSLNSIVILDHASSADPSLSPPTATAVLLALVCAFAIGLAYLVELLDPRIRSRTDVEGLYGAPLIGTL